MFCDFVFEFFVGIGFFVIFVEIVGGSFVLNELVEICVDFLCFFFLGCLVICFDVVQIDDYLDVGLCLSVILMNLFFLVVVNVDGWMIEVMVWYLCLVFVCFVFGGWFVVIIGVGFVLDVFVWFEIFGCLIEMVYLVFIGVVLGVVFVKYGISFEMWILVFDKCCGGEWGGIIVDFSQFMVVDVVQFFVWIVVEVFLCFELGVGDVV